MKRNLYDVAYICFTYFDICVISIKWVPRFISKLSAARTSNNDWQNPLRYGAPARPSTAMSPAVNRCIGLSQKLLVSQ